MRAFSFLLAASLLGGAAPVPVEAPGATGAHAFTGADGLRLWYRVAGRARGTPVIFLHGGPAEGSQAFARIVGPRLERHLRMVYLDQRGAGHSDKPDVPARYTAAAILADVEALRLRLGAAKVDLIGHSYGTMLALEYAAAHPDRVRHMVLTGAVPDAVAATDRECARLKGEDPAAYARAKQAANRPGDPDCIPFEGFAAGPARRDYAVRAAGARPGTMAAMDAADGAEGVDTNSPAHRVLAEPMFSYRFTRDDRLRMPILFVVGERDRLTDPAPALALAARLPRARVLRYPDAGHFLFVDDPARFATDVTAFLR